MLGCFHLCPPPAAFGGAKIVFVAGGSDISFAVTAEGILYIWGTDSFAFGTLPPAPLMQPITPTLPHLLHGRAPAPGRAVATASRAPAKRRAAPRPPLRDARGHTGTLPTPRRGLRAHGQWPAAPARSVRLQELKVWGSQTGPMLGSVGAAVIVSSSRTARCVVEPHGSANAVTKINVVSSHKTR